jgi:CRP-like cAMP-binding protein
VCSRHHNQPRPRYFIRTGKVEVTAFGKHVAVLSDGAYIGEIALLFSTQRSATVHAVTFVDLFMLCKADFDKVAAMFPEDRASMQVRAAQMRGRRETGCKQTTRALVHC